VLLRADRAAYVIGETMNLVAFTPVEFGEIYLDIVKAGQTLSTRSEPVASGRAEFAVDVSPDMVGTLELHAYKVLLDGTILRDTRLAVVDVPNDLAIAVRADKDTYLPGEMARVDFQTAGAQDAMPVQTALGVAIVDESVFALQRQDPGFAKLYFMLEQELMEPFYQVKGFELPAAISPDQQHIRQAQDQAAKAAWTGIPVASAAPPINSRQEKMNEVQSAQRDGFERIARGATLGLILIPVGLAIVVVIALSRARVLKRALVRVAVISLALLLLGGCLVGWLVATSELFLSVDPERFLIALAILFGLGALIFIGYAWLRRDPVAKILVLLTLAWGALIFLLIQATNQAPEPAEALVIAALLTYLLIPGAYLFFGQGMWLQARRFAGAISTGLGAVAVLPVVVILPVAFLFNFSGGMPLGAMAPAVPAAQRLEMGGDVLDFAAAEPEMAVEEAESGKEGQASAPAPDEEGTGEAPRLRQFFPETLYWAPEVVTDEDGFVSLEIPMADSITTWRLTALASSQDGRLGFTSRGIRVFQDFFVDIDLPVSLTQGDEISIPVGVFNYLPEAQEVRLVVEPEPWFELLGEGEQTLIIASNDIEVVYFPIRVLKFGRRGFQVTAWGETMSDAIRREVNVVPDGKEMRLSESDWLRESREVTIEIPPETVPETSYVEVKIYPGVMAQVIEGLEKILRLPHG
jgi:hypothetical protein